MKLLIVQPPWSWAIRPGGKDVENRGPGAINWLGDGPFPMLVQAGKRWSARGQESPLVRELADFPGLGHGPERLELERHTTTAVPRIFHPGQIVAATVVLDAHHAAPGCCPSRWGETTYQNADGTIADVVTHLHLEHTTVFEIPFDGMRGNLGLLTPPEDLVVDVLFELIEREWSGLELS